MKTIITENQNKNRPIYLETSMSQNLAFYKSYGFDNKIEIKDGI